jgi:hypothetical protein
MARRSRRRKSRSSIGGRQELGQEVEQELEQEVKQELVHEVERRLRSRNSRSSEGTKWFGVKPWIVIGGAIVLILILLFVPMFSEAKVIQVTNTIMATVQKQVPETVTEDVPTRVYVGYLQEKGQSYTTYTPPIIIIGGGPGGNEGSSGNRPEVEADTGRTGVSGGYGPVYGPSYNNYGSGRRYQIDVSDEIVDFQQANAPDGSLTITLTNADGKQTVYKHIDQYDLTKTGQINIPTTVTKMNTVSEQEPQQVTNQQVITVNVNLIQLLSANLREQ